MVRYNVFIFVNYCSFKRVRVKIPPARIPPGQNPAGHNTEGQNPAGHNTEGQNPAGQNPAVTKSLQLKKIFCEREILHAFVEEVVLFRKF
jgi:hypothetical protein